MELAYTLLKHLGKLCDGGTQTRIQYVNASVAIILTNFLVCMEAMGIIVPLHFDLYFDWGLHEDIIIVY